jgi:hypothetical protein
MTRTVPYDGYSIRGYYDQLGPAAKSISELFGNMDQDLATERNARVNASAPKVVNSRIRVQLSRVLTWAEKEELERDTADPHWRKLDGSSPIDGLKLWVSPERTHVWAEAPYGSRRLYELVAGLLASDYVNVFPTAVRTFREYNGE